MFKRVLIAPLDGQPKQLMLRERRWRTERKGAVLHLLEVYFPTEEQLRADAAKLGVAYSPTAVHCIGGTVDAPEDLMLTDEEIAALDRSVFSVTVEG